MLLETRFLLSLILTLIIEVPILIILYKYLFKLKKYSLPRVSGIGILASALTLPYLWFILPPYINAVYYICIGEILVFLTESLIYTKLLDINFRKALAISFTANLVSFFSGFYIS